MPSAFCYHAKPGGGKSEDLFPGDKSEHPYSWLDDTEVTAMSADGRFISIYEAGEVYALENSSLAYYRATDGSPAVRLGVGTAAISPDGKCFPRMGIRRTARRACRDLALSREGKPAVRSPSGV